MNDYGFTPGLLFGLEMEEGVEPDEDDVYNPLDRFYGNSEAWKEYYEGDYSDSDKVNYNSFVD